jgi:hypothetical protein
MGILQASIPMLADPDPDIENHSLKASVDRAIKLIAKLPGIIAEWERMGLMRTSQTYLPNPGVLQCY